MTSKQILTSMRPTVVRHGVTLLEILMSLAITATLLVALAMAFHASAGAVQSNDAYFRCTQTTRLTLNQVLAEIRRADAVQVDPTGLSIQIIRPADQLADGEIYRQYTYEPAAGRITLQIFHADKVGDAVYEVADHVTVCKFGSGDGLDRGYELGTPQCIAVTLTCSIAGTSVTLAGSATPRRMKG